MSAAETIRFEPWPDPEVESYGFPVRSAYVEFCYAGVVGPTGLLVLRLVAAMIAGAGGKGVTLELAELAHCLGVSAGTGHASLMRRTLRRLENFGLLLELPDGYAARLALRPLSKRQLRLAPATVQRLHERFMATRATESAEQSQAS